MSELGLGKKFEHRRGQQMRGRMPVNLERLGIFLVQQAQVGIFFQRTSQVDEIAVSLRHQRRIRQTRADGLGNVERSRALGNFLHAPIGELHMNAVSHNVEPAGVLNLSV